MPVSIITDPRKTTFEKGKNPYELLSAALNSYGMFTAWVADDKSTACAICQLSNARIFIAGTETDSELNFQSVSVPGYKTIGSLHVDRTKPVSFSPQNIASLIGPLTVDASYHVVAKVPGYEPLLQLVPNPVQAGDADYEPVLEHLLGENGIAAQRSTFTTAGIGAPDDGTTCSTGQRYLVYRIRFGQHPHKLAGTTSVSAYSEGFVLDCTRLGYAPSATGEQTAKVATTNNLLTNVSAFLVALAVAPNASWKGIGLSINAFSTIVDTDPTSSTVRDGVAAQSLRKLVGNLCVQLSSLPTPAPSGTRRPAPTATNDQLLAKNYAYTQLLTSPAGSQPLSTAVFAGSSPIPLACGTPLPDTSINSTTRTGTNSAGFDGVRIRWLHSPAPSPIPTPSPS
ncbi:MAG: hypothetical protein WCE44_14015 [Candidatus Velthaea sp.]